MRVATSEQQALAARRRAFAARLLDTPDFSWAMLGTLLCAAADDAAGDAGERQAFELVSASAALAAGAVDAGATS